MKHYLFVSHDANRAGAQLFILNLMQYLHERGHRLSILLLGDGVLVPDFERIATVYFYHQPAAATSRLSRFFGGNAGNPASVWEEINATKPDLAYVNTIAAASVAEELKAALNIPMVSHIHELEFSLQLYATAENRRKLFQLSDKIIACSNAVGENLIEHHNVAFDKVVTVHSFVDNQGINKRLAALNPAAIRTKLGLSPTTFVVSSCGNAEWRKGIDLFPQVANAFVQAHPETDVAFVWIGVKHEGELFEKAEYDLHKMGINSVVHLLEPTPEAVEIIGSSDVFLLTSREDPFPLVMLEAALAGKPILGFAKTGGCGEFVETDAGAVIPYLNIQAMANQLNEWQQQPETAKKLGQTARRKVTEIYNFETSVKKIEALLEAM